MECPMMECPMSLRVAQECVVAPGALGLAVLESVAPGAPARVDTHKHSGSPILEVSTVFEKLESEEPSRGNPGSWSREHVLSPLGWKSSPSGGHPSLSRGREIVFGGHPWSVHLSPGGSWAPGRRDKGGGRESFPCAPQ